MGDKLLTNEEIIEIYTKNGLIKRCVECQFVKLEQGKQQFRDDFKQDLYIILRNYPNDKLNDAHTHHRMNALLTSILINNLHSQTSPFYRTYLRLDRLTSDIDTLIKDEDRDDFETKDEMYGDDNNYIKERNHLIKI